MIVEKTSYIRLMFSLNPRFFILDKPMTTFHEGCPTSNAQTDALKLKQGQHSHNNNQALQTACPN